MELKEESKLGILATHVLLSPCLDAFGIQKLLAPLLLAINFWRENYSLYFDV
jgi:hypothetical protein